MAKKEVNDYLKTRRGLKALLTFFRNDSVTEAVSKLPSFGLCFLGGKCRCTLNDNVGQWDTMFDMYLDQKELY